MSDAHLTDHEWKLKMAAEGRAFYLPGRTAAEVQQEQERMDHDTITVTLNIRQAEALETAMVDLPELTLLAASALETLSAALITGQLGGEDAHPILALMARGLKSAETREITALEAFDATLRESLSSYRQSKVQGGRRKKA